MRNTIHPKRALVIAYDFPPRRTSGVYRTTHLTKYLNGLGWHPTVLTVTERPGDIEDPTLLRDFPSEISVERARDLNISGWESKAATGIRATGGLKSDHRDSFQPRLDRWVRSAGTFLRSCLYFPDDTVGWVPTALAQATGLMMQHRFDLVYTTSPPRAASVVGWLLHLLLGIPWIAEFRDPWYPRDRPLRRRADRWLLRRMLRSAAKVVLISRGHGQFLEKEYALPAEKIEVVSNGYEEADFTAPTEHMGELLPPGYIHLSHFGTVYSRLSGRFFEALAAVVRECPDLRNRLRINVIGFPDDIVRRAAVDLDLRDVVRIYEFVTHDIAIDAMRASDVLLVFLGRRDIARLSGLGKIFDYLRVGRPVLAVAFEGGTAELVRDGQVGWVVQPDDVEAIKNTLRSVLHACHTGELPRPAPAEFVRQFRYDRLAEKLAGVFDSVLNHDS